MNLEGISFRMIFPKMVSLMSLPGAADWAFSASFDMLRTLLGRFLIVTAPDKTRVNGKGLDLLTRAKPMRIEHRERNNMDRLSTIAKRRTRRGKKGFFSEVTGQEGAPRTTTKIGHQLGRNQTKQSANKNDLQINRCTLTVAKAIVHSVYYTHTFLNAVALLSLQ